MGKWASEIIRAELLGEVVGREVARVVGPTPLREPRVTQLPAPYRHKVVESGEKDVTIYEEKVPVGRIIFLQRIGNNYFEDAYLKWWVDGHLVISPYIDFEIASPNNPLHLEPWMRVDEEVLWTGTNNSELSCDFEVFCQGIMVLSEDVPILLKLGMPISRKE